MAASGAFIAYVCDQLRPWAPVAARRMFSGHGLFRSGTMFALIHADAVYFRTDAENCSDFAAVGMPPFRYARAGRDVALGYHEVPVGILDEADALAAWAEKAYAAALRQAARRPGRGRLGMRRGQPA
jgi:DNA transformation protein